MLDLDLFLELIQRVLVCNVISSNAIRVERLSIKKECRISLEDARWLG
jgi:hypothetical protein